jgi:hypothetical protein
LTKLFFLAAGQVYVDHFSMKDFLLWCPFERKATSKQKAPNGPLSENIFDPQRNINFNHDFPIRKHQEKHQKHHVVCVRFRSIIEHNLLQKAEGEGSEAWLRWWALQSYARSQKDIFPMKYNVLIPASLELWLGLGELSTG